MTGETTVQVYEYVAYHGNWRHYNRVNYESPDGPIAGDLQVISNDVVTCANSEIMGGCKLVEHVAFDFPLHLLSDFKYDPENLSVWRYRFKSKAGLDWDSGFLAGEMAGFLKVLSEIQKKYPKLP